MRIHVDRPVCTLEGEPFSPPTTLRASIFHALMSPLPEDQNLPLDKKLKIHQLAHYALHGGTTEKIGTLEITAAVMHFDSGQLELIKQRADKVFQIHFLGQFISMIEQEWEPPRSSESESARESQTYQPAEAAANSKAMHTNLQ